LWFESESLFEARLVSREEVRPASGPRDMAQAGEMLQGQQVHVTLTDGKILGGKLLAYPELEQSEPPLTPSLSSIARPIPMPTGNVLVLENQGGVAFIPVSSVLWINASEGGAASKFTETVTIPSLEFVVNETAGTESTITLSYLTNGMAWAPSYRVDYDASGTATISASTIIRNEWRDLVDTRVELISGFPHIEYSPVTTPLWHEMTLASFFTQLSGLDSPRGGGIMSQQMVVMNYARPQDDSSWNPADALPGAGEDLAFVDIGPTTLAANTATSRPLAARSTPAVRFVDWHIPDDRDLYGRQESSTPEHEAWDSIRFTNPFDFPLTTAPVSVWMEDRFRGQSTATFTNPGAEAVVNATKALSVETLFEEFDLERGDQRRIMSVDVIPVTVRAEMKVTNRRNTPARVEISREFQGVLRAASHPTEKLRTLSRRNALNPSNEAKWVIDVPAGGETLVTLDYEVLVRS
jgi:hypothetical protein